MAIAQTKFLKPITRAFGLATDPEQPVLEDRASELEPEVRAALRQKLAANEQAIFSDSPKKRTEPNRYDEFHQSFYSTDDTPEIRFPKSLDDLFEVTRKKIYEEIDRDFAGVDHEYTGKIRFVKPFENLQQPLVNLVHKLYSSNDEQRIELLTNLLESKLEGYDSKLGYFYHASSVIKLFSELPVNALLETGADGTSLVDKLMKSNPELYADILSANLKKGDRGELTTNLQSKFSNEVAKDLVMTRGYVGSLTELFPSEQEDAVMGIILNSLIDLYQQSEKPTFLQSIVPQYFMSLRPETLPKHADVIERIINLDRANAISLFDAALTRPPQSYLDTDIVTELDGILRHSKKENPFLSIVLEQCLTKYSDVPFGNQFCGPCDAAIITLFQIEPESAVRIVNKVAETDPAVAQECKDDLIKHIQRGIDMANKLLQNKDRDTPERHIKACNRMINEGAELIAIYERIENEHSKGASIPANANCTVAATSAAVRKDGPANEV